MKLVLFTLSICLAALGSCCHKVDCASLMGSVKLYNFTEQELSEIYIIQHEGQDTSRISAHLSMDSTYYKVYALDGAMHQRENVTLYLPLPNKTYVFSDFRFEEKECKAAKCLWRKSYFTEFTGCTINGQQYGKEINLYKE